MAEHYTKNTLEATCWCNKCNRMTQHRVDGGRRGPCLEHHAAEFSKEQMKRMAKNKKSSRNLSLFESNAPPTPVERQEAAIAAFVPQIDATACPKCGSRSQTTAHPVEHEGKTRYCVTCATPDGPYYFLPDGGA